MTHDEALALAREAKRIADAATEGPWFGGYMAQADSPAPLSPDEVGQYVAATIRLSAETSGHERFYFLRAQKPDGPADVCLTGNGPTSLENAAFTAHARTAVPALAAAVEELVAEVRRIRTETVEECARVAEGGRFLHADAPAARFGRECAAAIRRLNDKEAT